MLSLNTESLKLDGLVNPLALLVDLILSPILISLNDLTTSFSSAAKYQNPFLVYIPYGLT